MTRLPKTRATLWLERLRLEWLRQLDLFADLRTQAVGARAALAALAKRWRERRAERRMKSQGGGQ
jgi:hypothetical protein